MPATIDLTKDTGAPDTEEQPSAEKGNCGSSGQEENGVGQSAKGKGKGKGKGRERYEPAPIPPGVVYPDPGRQQDLSPNRLGRPISLFDED